MAAWQNILLKIFVLNFLFCSNFVFSASLDDIRNKLKLNNKNLQNNRNEQKKQIVIKSLRPVNMKGWVAESDQGGIEVLFAVEAIFRVNEKGDSIPVSNMVCYFYDKDKNLIDMKRPGFMIQEGKVDPVKIPEGTIFVKGRRNISIFFTYKGSFKYKYALCVIGNGDCTDVICFPRSEKFETFDFDQKHLLVPSYPEKLHKI